MDLSSAAPQTLGKYQIRGVLGRGAMGTVYDGWDPAIGRRVAIKTVRLLGDADAETVEGLERFKREAQAAGRLSHPNIVGVYDYGETEETAYIVMEFVEGRSLKQLIDARERFPVDETVRVMEQILAALQFSHDSGVVHRDIKPANVMMTKSGRVKLADFGIARIESSVMTQDGTMLGTPAYMSPEQLMAQTVDARSDLYSSGVLLYQLLTGERPFEGGLTAIIHKALNTVPPRPSEISVTSPVSFDAVVARAMSKRPADRYADADAFAAALRAALMAPAPPPPPLGADGEDADATMVAHPAPAPTPAPTASPVPMPSPAPMPAPVAATGGNTGMLVGGALVAVLLAAGGGWLALRPSSPPIPTPTANTATPLARPAAEPQVAAQVAAPAPLPVAPPASPAIASVAIPLAAIPSVAIPSAPISSASTQQPAAAPPALAPIPQPPAPQIMTAVPLPTPAVDKPPPPPMVAAIVPPSPAAIRDALARLAATAGCAMPRFSVADDGAVSALGLVGAGAPATALHDAVQQAVGSTPVNWSMRAVDGPYCEAFDVVRPIAQQFGPALSLTLKDDATHLMDGDAIRPIVKLPDFPSHLQVDYLSHDGSVTHLLPDQGAADKTFAANATLPLGDPKKGVGEVGPPFGTDVILAIASSVPLFPKHRPSSDETTQTYLPALQAAIDAARRGNARVAGRALVLETVPR